MTQNEIKQKIDENNRKIEKAFNPAIFVLNDDIAALLVENNMLRAQCAHEYDENGMCIYCYAKEGESNGN